MDWLANALILIGSYRVGNRQRDAFLWTIAGEAVWTVYAASIGLYSLSFICVVFGLFSFRNWVKWGK